MEGIPDPRLIERETEWLVNTFRGGLIAKNYGDLHGIGVQPEWDQWAYEAFVRAGDAWTVSADETNRSV